jgi:Membrane protein involved in the export of O-antigen and teichoic acid
MQIFQLIRYSTLILIGIVFSKSALTKSEIGQYETVLFISGAVSFFWVNGLIQGFLPSSNKYSGKRKSSDLFNIFYLLLFLSALASLFLLVFEHAISSILLKSSGVPFLKYLIIYVLLAAPSGLVEYIYLIKEKSKSLLRYGIISYFLMFGLAVAPAWWGSGLEYCLAGLVLSAAIRFVWLFVLLLKYSSLEFNFSFILKHIKVAGPLVLSMFLSGSGQYIDGFIITGYFDDATFAVFRFGAREFPLVLLLANAFSASMLPGFSDQSRLGDNLAEIKRNAQKLAIWLFPLSGLLMAVSHWLFPIVFNSGFKESAVVFNIYLLLIVSRLVFPQTILTGLGKNKAILWASLFEIILNVALSLWFVQVWGLFGVAYGTVCAYIFEKLILMVFVKKISGLRVSDYLNVGRHLVYSVLLLAEFILIEFLIY